MITEADFFREFVTPTRIKAGCDAAPHDISRERSFSNGRNTVAGGQVAREKLNRADYVLFDRRDHPLAVVEAKEVLLEVWTVFAEVGGRTNVDCRGLRPSDFLCYSIPVVPMDKQLIVREMHRPAQAVKVPHTGIHQTKASLLSPTLERFFARRA